MRFDPLEDLFVIFQSAIQSLLGGLVAWLLTCVVAGAIPSVLSAQWPPEIGWFIVLAWLVHLVYAGMAIWGLLTICVHALCLAALIYGTHNGFAALSITFFAQLTTSTIVVILLDSDLWWRPATGWAFCSCFLACYWITSFRRSRMP